ncbi:histidine kinase [Alkalihalobacillus pseudalcaliphilus]|uniref:HAMP domain-containing sensor histidine kinase n=1 Tax=Alkalihalobacillus pseudalcaliphilus TaxID=79884 RepID=UPI00069D166C|nr:histidine kinase [Alkalihalobacillus pseudalcaliphilus]
MKKRLARMRWQFIRFHILISLLTVLLTLIIFTYEESRGLLVVFDRKLLEIPIFFWFLVLFIIVGGIGGFIQADGIKKRIDLLLDGAVRYARGSFSHRMDVQGDDEISELTEQMNDMASHIEEQVASLQRLSQERVQLQDTIKKTAVTEERQRLARDLHDAVSQQLFAISMMMAAIKQSTIHLDESLQKQVQLVESMANAAQAEMRALLLHLRPAHLEGKDLKEGLEQLFIELKQKQKLEVISEIRLVDKLPKAIEEQLFRLTQEALSNILRHAQADKIEFHIREVNQELKVKIIDNGIGFNLSEVNQGSYGLQTMKERMNEIGGTLHIITVPEKGTQIEVKIPIAWRGE